MHLMKHIIFICFFRWTNIASLQRNPIFTCFFFLLLPSVFNFANANISWFQLNIQFVKLIHVYIKFVILFVMKIFHLINLFKFHHLMVYIINTQRVIFYTYISYFALISINRYFSKIIILSKKKEERESTSFSPCKQTNFIEKEIATTSYK